jgi:hypothetical protein
MPQRISSYGLASAKDYTAIIYGGVPGVEGEVRKPISQRWMPGPPQAMLRGAVIPRTPRGRRQKGWGIVERHALQICKCSLDTTTIRKCGSLGTLSHSVCVTSICTLWSGVLGNGHAPFWSSGNMPMCYRLFMGTPARITVPTTSTTQNCSSLQTPLQ